jgi:hypothetical protein
MVMTLDGTYSGGSLGNNVPQKLKKLFVKTRNISVHFKEYYLY